MRDRALWDLAVGGAAQPSADQVTPVLTFLDSIGERPFAMLNLLAFRKRARYGGDYDGAEGPPEVSGAEAFQRYLSVARTLPSGTGVEAIWAGPPGPAWVGRSVRWDLAIIARYPSPATFLERMADPEYRLRALPHRAAALKRALTLPIAQLQEPT